MMLKRLLLAFLLALAVPAPLAATQQRAAESSASISPRPAALALAQTIYTAEVQLSSVEKFLDNQFVPALLKDAGIQQMEKQHPGILAALASAVKPTFRKYIVQELPAYHRGMAQVYSSAFTDAELVEMQRFFAGPTGRKLSSGVQQNVSFDAVMGEAVADPGARTSVEAIDRDQKQAVERTIESIDSSDYPALLSIRKTSWFPKMAKVRPKVLEFEAQFMNAPSTAFEKEFNDVMTKTLERYIAKANSR